MGFGSYFRDLRIEKQITQKQIADVIKKKPMLVLWDFLYWLRLSAVCLESGRYLQGYSRPEPVGQCLKCCLYLLL